jgi:hypothetical protein
VNGYSGFSPPHYAVLNRALDEADDTILTEVAATGPVLVAVDRRADYDRRLQDLAARIPGAEELGLEGRWKFIRLPESNHPNAGKSGSGTATACSEHATVTAISAAAHPEPVIGEPQGGLDKLFDGDVDSGWISPGLQQAGDALTLSLASEARVCSLSLLLGNGPEVYPGAVGIDLSSDGLTWDTVFEGQTGGLAMAGALRDPIRSPVTFEWAGRPAKTIRIRLLASHTIYAWAMREVVVGAER